METLARHIETQGPLPVRDAIGWVLRAALTVWDLHVDGTTHGRLHAGAILIADADCRSEGVLLSPLEVEEDERYHCLERAADGHPSKLDDVWGLGITLYLALTGKLPYPQGAATAREAGKRPRPLAMSGSGLDVMQPVIDRFIGGDMALASIDQLVVGLQEFSPTIADVEPLAIEGEMPPTPEPPPLDDPEDLGKPRSIRPESRRPSAPPDRRGDRSLTIGLGLAGLAAVVVLFVMASRRGGDPAEPPGSRSATATVPATSSATASAKTRPAPAPDPAPAPPSPGGSDDMVACLADVFPDNAFAASKPGGTFPCRERTPKRVHLAITAALAVGGGGQATAAAKEWSHLGWYQVAAMQLARAHCCQGAPPFDVPPLLGVCGIDEAVAGIGQTAIHGNDTEVAKALDAYRVASHCALTAGGAGFFMQTEAPKKREAALFVRMVSRFRSKIR